MSLTIEDALGEVDQIVTDLGPGAMLLDMAEAIASRCKDIDPEDIAKAMFAFSQTAVMLGGSMETIGTGMFTSLMVGVILGRAAAVHEVDTFHIPTHIPEGE